MAQRLRTVRDRQLLAHAASSSSSRVTVAAVRAARAEELPVHARGHDPPVLEEDDPVRLVEHERAGADDDRRPTRARLAKAPRDAGLRVGVDCARRLDEHEDLGVRKQRSGQDDALPLAARERAAALLDVAVQPVRQRLEHVLGVCDGDGLEDRPDRPSGPRGRARVAACRRRAADRSR